MTSTSDLNKYTIDNIHEMEAIPGDYWTWRGQKIYYVKAGNSVAEKPTLLLIHGFGASTDHWRKNITPLSDKFNVLAIDLLGFGRSAKPQWEYTAKLWQEQISDFITEICQTKTILAGNSLGGYVSLATAANYPEKVSGLILLNPAGPFHNPNPIEPNKIQKAINKLLLKTIRKPWANKLLFKYVQRKSFIKKTLEKVYVDKSAITPKLIEDIYRPSCDRGAPEVFSSVFSSPQGAKVDELLQQLSCPLLMLWGMADPWMNYQQRGPKFKEYYPQLTEFCLNAGHCPHDEIPLQVNQIIESWVK